MSAGELPRLADELPRLLGRRGAFGLVLCTVASRRAMDDAFEELVRLARAAGRRVASVGRGAGGTVLFAPLDDSTWDARRRALLDLNRRRDALADRGILLVLGLLAPDLPRLAGAAPDLWTVRTAVVAHAPDPFPGALLPHDPRATEPVTRAPRPLEALAVHVPLRLFRLDGGTSGPARPPDLDDLFVPPPASGPGRDGASLAGPAPELLSRYDVAVLEAPAGAGKTTVLRRYARDRARAGEPVLLVEAEALGDAPLGVDDLDAALRALRAACPWPARGGPPVVLLDGLDQLGAPGDREEALRALDDLVRCGMARQALAGTRPDALPRRGDLPPALRLHGFRQQEVEAYIARWARASGMPAETARELRRNALGPALEGVLERPLLLALYCAAAWTAGRPPEDATEFLGAAIDAMIPAHPRFRHDDLRWVARKVAWILRERGPLAPERLAAALRAETGLHGEFLDLLEQHAALLERRGAGRGLRLAFVHDAIAEVLVAEELLDRVPAWSPELAQAHLLHPLLAEFHEVGLRYLQLSARLAPRRCRDALRRDNVRGRHLPPEVVATLRARAVAGAWPRRRPLALRSLVEEIRAELRAIVDADGDPRDRERRPARWLGRCMAADSLVALDDPAFGRLQWVELPGGWALARWPVTVREYRAFVEDGGYDDPTWWTPAGWRWRRRPRRTRSGDRPQGWLDQCNAPWAEAAPVRGLSHHEAAAFAAWTAARLDDPRIALPPVEAWREAARRGPWWDRPPPPPPLAFQRPPPVGADRPAATADGVEDLGTLVREWLAPQGDAIEPWGGRAWCERPVPLREALGRRNARSGRRWPHLYGVRLARRPYSSSSRSGEAAGS